MEQAGAGLELLIKNNTGPNKQKCQKRLDKIRANREESKRNTGKG